MHNVSAFALLHLSTILQSGRSMVVGHVLTVHTCSFLTPLALFMTYGTLASSRLSSCKQQTAANFWDMMRLNTPDDTYMETYSISGITFKKF